MILDCTLRDGGYYTNWDWPYDFVVRYLETMESCDDVDILELGFRGETGGKYADLSDEWIETLEVPKSKRIAIMLNTARLRNVSDLSTHLAQAKDSPVDIVRLATHIEDLDRVGPYIARVKEMGYECWLNIMQATQYFPPPSIPRRWGRPDMIVLADSLGESDAGEGEIWLSDIQFGYHPHNNLGQATGEAERALNSWAACVDSSVCGLGRGAGNARTELLVRDIPQSLVDLCADIEAMRPELKWGPSPLYAYAALHGIHPTYVQNGATLDELRELHGKRRYEP